MKKTVSAYVYNTIERYPEILKTPKVEKAMGNLKCWMALRVNRGFDNSSYKSIKWLDGASTRWTCIKLDDSTPLWPLWLGIMSTMSHDRIHGMLEHLILYAN